MPRVKDDEELNAHLRRCCLAELERTVAGQTQTIGQRWTVEKAAAVALAAHPFDPCILTAGQVDHYQTVRYDKVRYSVPRDCTGLVTLKAYADRIAVMHRARVVAEHPRKYDGSTQLDPMHYLVTLLRRPGALDHSDLYRQWQLPAAFAQLRTQLETRHGASAGVRHYIRVLQLLAEHPLARVQQAVDAALAQGPALWDADLIARQVEHLRHPPTAANHAAAGGTPTADPVQSLCVPVPDLGRFNQLLEGPARAENALSPASFLPEPASPASPMTASSSIGDSPHA